ncbi:MAG: hypothetical protein ACLRO1_07865, partial [Agathobaculum sp.]
MCLPCWTARTLKAHTGTKHSTIELYKHLCERINPAIGHFKLTEIRPQHLNRLYVSLAEDCIKHSADNARAKVDLGHCWQNGKSPALPYRDKRNSAH